MAEFVPTKPNPGSISKYATIKLQPSFRSSKNPIRKAGQANPLNAVVPKPLPIKPSYLAPLAVHILPPHPPTLCRNPPRPPRSHELHRLPETPSKLNLTRAHALLPCQKAGNRTPTDAASTYEIIHTQIKTRRLLSHRHNHVPEPGFPHLLAV